MGKIAFVFPGQGAQYTGMGKQIAENFPASMKVFEQASDVLAYDVAKMVFDGDEETLKITENTQPAILTVSIACLAALTDNGIRAEITAGLSLGEYTALVYAESMEFRDAVCLVRKRGKYMQEAVPLGIGTMAAIIGLENNVVAECCIEASKEGIVEPANYNCPGQVVIAGEVSAVNKAMELCSQKGAKRTITLQVSAPFHCSMLESAGKKLALELEKTKVHKMSLPVVANVNAQYVANESIVKDLLIKQVSSPVLWEDSVRNMIKNGVDIFIEIGPGKVLTGFIKRINKDVKVFNVENIESLNETLKEVHK